MSQGKEAQQELLRVSSVGAHLGVGLQCEARSFEFLKGMEASKQLTKAFLERRMTAGNRHG